MTLAYLLLASTFLLNVFFKKEKLFLAFFSVYLAPLATWLFFHFFPDFSLVWGWDQYLPLLFFVFIFLFFCFLFSFAPVGQFSQAVTPTQTATNLISRLVLSGLLISLAHFFLPASLEIDLLPVWHYGFATIPSLIVWLLLPIFLAFSFRLQTRRGWIE
ncbi:MAG TPA: hypothetical protein VJB37_02130 [Patescibacteria group bacterium]|nr:hypothetical protein [Patescibacteria group bacterium]